MSVNSGLVYYGNPPLLLLQIQDALNLRMPSTSIKFGTVLRVKFLTDHYSYPISGLFICQFWTVYTSQRKIRDCENSGVTFYCCHLRLQIRVCCHHSLLHLRIYLSHGHKKKNSELFSSSQKFYLS